MKIAIFGAGQLAMMMIEASSDLSHEFIVIDPASRPPASKLAKHYMVEYNDEEILKFVASDCDICLLYTSPSPRDRYISRMPSSA